MSDEIDTNGHCTSSDEILEMYNVLGYIGMKTQWRQDVRPQCFVEFMFFQRVFHNYIIDTVVMHRNITPSVHLIDEQKQYSLLWTMKFTPVLEVMGRKYRGSCSNLRNMCNYYILFYMNICICTCIICIYEFDYLCLLVGCLDPQSSQEMSGYDRNRSKTA